MQFEARVGNGVVFNQQESDNPSRLTQGGRRHAIFPLQKKKRERRHEKPQQLANITKQGVKYRQERS